MIEETQEQQQKPQELESPGRNEDGTFKEGHTKIPGSGRPKNTLKDYLRRKFNNMTDEEKEAWLVENKVPGVDQFKMAEGNPHQSSDVDVTGGLEIKFDSSFKKDAKESV